jgi:hypothetical protein
VPQQFLTGYHHGLGGGQSEPDVGVVALHQFQPDFLATSRREENPFTWIAFEN